MAIARGVLGCNGLTDSTGELRSDPDLVVRLDTALPAALALGGGNAIFVRGGCFHRRVRVRSVEIEVEGQGNVVAAHGMPRSDLYEEFGAAAYRSGFWAVVPLRADLEGTVEVSVLATLSAGHRARDRVAAIGLIDGPSAAPTSTAATSPGGDSGGLVAICMATFNPDPELFARQLESIRGQTDGEWACFISDDSSDPDSFERIATAIDGDSRFRLSRSERRLGFYRNFERALRMAPPEAPLIAFCDQDDRWMPEKLAILRDAIGAAMLVYSDQRIVGESGSVLSATYWNKRMNNFSDLASLLIANTVTGAASLFRREVLDSALPFPAAPGEVYHDHWVALVALSLGRIAYVDRPLYDYVQHGAAVLGHAGANIPSHEGANRWRTRLRHPKSVIGRWRDLYFFDYCRLVLLATVLLLRCGKAMSEDKQLALERIVDAERSPRCWARLAVRPYRALLGRSETLGREKGLALGIVWRHTLAMMAAGRRRPARWMPRDASFRSGGVKSG